MPAHRTPALARVITGRRTAWLVALVPILLALAVLALVPEGERETTSTDASPVGADSTSAAQLLDELPEDEGQVAIVLWTADDGELSRQAQGELTKQAVGLLSDAGGGGEAPEGAGDGPPGAQGEESQGEEGQGDEGQGRRSPLVVAEDGTAAFVAVPVLSSSNTDNIDKVEDLRSTLTDDVPDGVTVQVTGPAGIQADIGQVFDGADFRLLAATAAVVAILLIITYRSPVLWLVPLTVVGIADRLAAIVATNVLEVTGVAWDESTVGILSVLVFGAGTDYALLLISRYRDELKTTESRFEAMGHALSRTFEAVLSSSTTVVLGLLTLLLSSIPTTRGLGLACAVGVLIAATFALVVLPAALVVFGRWIFWPRVPRVGDTVLVDSNSLWHRVGDAVARRPRTFVVATIAGLAVLASGTASITTGLRPADQFVQRPEAISAAERLGESFPAGTSDPIQVATRADAEQVLKAVEDVDGVSSARVTTSADGISQIDAVPDAEPGSEEAQALVGSVRDAVDGFDDTHVGGGDAEAVDAEEYAERDRLVILPLILLLVLGALVVLLRSVVAPLLLVATVLATYAAAMGASWWLFQTVFDFAAMDTGVPLLAFLFLVALGVDYNIFLVTRAREEAREHGTRAGMLRALTATGGVITSAGILLAAVFAVLGVLPLVVLAQLGAIIFVGVLLDTLVVRTVLVPALALTLGERFWWPRRVTAREG
ncbi:RND superfamily putative drug exporter [Nocardioides cavernae]|uniref:RND superfamily putative drug exporter n=1 Tax=Nocardioides cavernae TaxID=1921566 RepID=A0A7Y9H1V4_9ACTN|nr:MMPL family transporter [Nocardioides cavernae]NYE36300.1 RND superfamily putative drug exporter [Nocardioides cavernae]